MYVRFQRLQDVYGLPESVKRAVLMVCNKYASMTESERTLAALVGINVLVFGAWQVPRWTPFMSRWFLHHPGGSHPITLVTSCFSHKEGLHLAFNMVGLWSFGGLMHDYLGREQFLAMYLSTGIGANMVSHTMSLALRHSRPLLPSLGASGALYGLLAGTAYLQPNASVSLIFLPMVPIKLGYALPAMMGFDLAGILLKWKMFDHFAHLAGASIGLGYMAYGPQYIWSPLIHRIEQARHHHRQEA
ncbi:rhomboid-domain-containing protein [Hesseltinella vesiculosa]|uniref:Rhomboid-domain-containing protein n=1 Tax=Hesseltinella vesiculosa TaxID=101127 RepID=A0A1X2GF77_9FUNG|nr:rhomboid-domain-containing protein [Hesseltinella vesiculosa]